MGKAKYHSLKRTPESRLYWRHGYQAMRQFNYLLHRDVVFVSFDIEGVHKRGKAHIAEIGIAVLDTRDLLEKDDAEIISARHICTRTRDISLKGRYFLFGESEHVRKGRKQTNTAEFVRSLFYIEDTQQTSAADRSTRTSKKYRDIVLVGHGLRGDLSSLFELGLDVQTILPMIAVVDTEAISMRHFRLPKGLSLLNLLTCLGIPSAKLHNAGNDAMFTMKALLALAVQAQWQGPLEKVEQMRRVAHLTLDFNKILNERRELIVAEKRALGPRRGKEENEEDWADILDGLNIEAD